MKQISENERILNSQKKLLNSTIRFITDKAIGGYTKFKHTENKPVLAYSYFVNFKNFDFINKNSFILKKELSDREKDLLFEIIYMIIIYFHMRYFKFEYFVFDPKMVNNMIKEIEILLNDYVEVNPEVFISYVDLITLDYARQIQNFIKELNAKNSGIKNFLTLEEINEINTLKSFSDLENIIFPRCIITHNVIEIIKLE